MAKGIVRDGAGVTLYDYFSEFGLAQLARSDGSAIEVKTKASILPVNKRPRLAVKIASSN